MTSDAVWTTEALRLFRRYQYEIVEKLGLCPWAEPSRRSGAMVERVLLQTAEGIEASLDVLAKLAAEPHIEIAVLIYPRLAMGVLDFDRFVARLRDADAPLHPLGEIPFAMAAFHPDGPIDQRTPERLIPFLRRTPDRTIQIVRSTVLDRVRGGSPQGTSFVNVATIDFDAVAQAQPPPLRERIARANRAKVESLGVGDVMQRLDDIRRDRDVTYARLGGAS
jgi:hypothetical protein